MQLFKAFIERVSRVSPEYQHLELASVDATLTGIKPGQSLLVRQVNAENEVVEWSPYLRERWWPIGLTAAGILKVERPASISYLPGQTLSILGPVGKPFGFRKSLRNVLLIADDTEPTPLTIMIQLLLANRISVALVLIGRAQRYSTHHLPPEVEVIHSDDFNWPDNITSFGWADQIFVTVAQDDEMQHFARVLRVIQEKRRDVPPSYVFGVFQSPVVCAVGACQCCAVTMKQRSSLVRACIDGPAFDLTLVRLPE